MNNKNKRLVISFFALLCFMTTQAGTTASVSKMDVSAKKDSCQLPLIKCAWKNNFSYTGLPLCATGLIIWYNQKSYRSMRNHFLPDFHSKYDDFTQYSPLALTAVLKACGVKTRNNWAQLSVNSAMSAVLMASIVNSMKYGIKEMRPDNTTRNSFPSGHTATAFMCATIMHKELGHKSPWFSVSAYSLASLTGLFRILNNRHWVNDVVFGAGVGITSADLGYFLGDLIFKNRKSPPGLHGNDIDNSNPSFFSFEMSMGTGTDLSCPVVYTLPPSQNKNNQINPPLGLNLKMGTVTSVSLEGAYFINRYIGFGGNVKFSVCPIVADYDNEIQPYIVEFDKKDLAPYELLHIESDDLGIVDLHVGVYGAVPINKRWSAGAKFLAGRSYTTGLSLNSFSRLKKEYYPLLDKAHEMGIIDRDEMTEIKNGVIGKDFIKLDKSRTWGFSTGISCSYFLRKGTAIRTFVDYTYSKPCLTYHIYSHVKIMEEKETATETFVPNDYRKRSALKSLSGGISLAVMF